MPLSAPVLVFPFERLDPLYPGPANEIPVNLPPNVTYRFGTILGQVAATASDVQTITITGGPTGGTFTLAANGGTATLPYNAAPAAVQAALVSLYGPGTVTVTGTAGTTYVATFGGSMANLPVAPVAATAAFTGGTTPAIAVAHTAIGSTTGTWAAYAAGNTDGSQNPSLILRYTVTSNGYGDVFFGSGGTAGEYGQSYRDCPAFRKGTFRTADLVGLDANAIGKLGRLIAGTPAAGILQID
jgi:hypothetical protein